MNTISKLEQFIGNEVRIEYQQNDSMQWLEEKPNFIPNILNNINEYKNLENYKKEIYDLAEKNPYSIFDYAKYAYRDLNVDYPQAYIIAAKRDYHTKEKSKNIHSLEDAFNIMNSILSEESIFLNRDRIALPDEVLYFKKGNDRDRALLLYCLLVNFVKTPDFFIVFTQDSSFVKYGDLYINSSTLAKTGKTPDNIQIIFNDREKRNLYDKDKKQHF